MSSYHFNPNSAFPRQSTYTPGAGLQVQRAVNAPRFGDVGTGGARAQPLTAAYGYVAANAARVAMGAPGGVANIRALHAQHGKFTQGLDNVVRRQGQRAQQMMGRGRPATGAADEIYARGADVVASAMTPVSASWDPDNAPPLIAGRQNQPWDTLLDPGSPPRFDPLGHRDASLHVDVPTPRVTSRGRPRPQTVTQPFQQPLF